MGMKSGGGEIIQVEGGHIVRSTGRKDRHSKVFTAKGPRDRRVRLSAHTAIQFYDVQDRLGYDRPSKAVDWLIRKAKSAIDKLAELPPWHPSDNTDANLEEDLNAGSSEMAMAEQQSESSGYGFQLHRHLASNPGNDSSFIAPSMDPHTIPDDTMKSFFPTSSTNSSMNFQSYHPDIISRTTNHTQDLGLSLHSFQDQGLIHGQSQAADTSHRTHSNDHHHILEGLSPVGFEANFQRMVSWSSETTSSDNRTVEGFAFNPHPLPTPQALLGQGSAFSQRGPLQSSFAQSIRAWGDLPMSSNNHHRTQEIHQSLIFGSRFAPHQGLSGFSIPARIHGEEEGSVISDRPSSSPNSQH
ncbi:hypothetical protein K2173_001775 [Erythroxylum novogranatense]|uniref:TCP domain-containing protein n=1 Tax=Erythroxylum novogranatense TaxID=1862640 RepID=A0AAV8SJM2_9ROSI|nr:hypothetical protein K2173_001775 [Erythroxylum novogranatense]